MLSLLPLTLFVSVSHINSHVEHRSFSTIPQISLPQEGKTLDPGVAAEVEEDVTLLHIIAYDLTLPKMPLR